MTDSKHKCQECTAEFTSDSPYHDSYCGDCRIYYYELLKLMNSRQEVPQD